MNRTLAFSLLIFVFTLIVSCENDKAIYNKSQKDLIANFEKITNDTLYKAYPDSALSYSLKIIDLCDKIKNDTLLVNALNHASTIYTFMGNYDSSDSLLKISYKQALNLKDTAKLVVISNSLANNMVNKQDFNGAKMLYKETISNYSTGISDYLISLLYANLGDVFYRTNQLDSAMVAFQKALKYYGIEKDKQHAAHVLNNISNIYADEGLFDKAIITLQKAININDSLGNIMQLGLNYGNLALLYKQSENYEEAVVYLKKAIELKEKTQNPFIVIISKFNLGNTYMTMGKFAEAKDILNEVYTWSVENDIVEGQIRALIALAKTENKLQNKENAIDLFHNALDLCNEEMYLSFKRDILFNLAQLYTKNTSDTIDYLAQYKVILDSISKKDVLAKVLEIEAKYENEKAEEEIRNLKELNRLENLQNSILIVLIVLLTVSVILLYILFRVRNENLRQSKQLLEHKQVNQNLRLAQAEKDAIIQKEESKNAQLNLKLKEQEIIYHALSKARVISTLSDLKISINKLITDNNDKIISEELRIIKSNIESISRVDTLKEFERVFEAVHPDFYSNLLAKFPDLSPRELLYCAFLRLNMQTKDIALITNNYTKSLETSRYRIRKKLGLLTNQNLSTELMKY